MEIQITSTDKITELDGVPVRVWEGVTASGIACKVFVHRIALRDDAPAAEDARFAAELKEQLPPGRFVPLSLIL